MDYIVVLSSNSLGGNMRNSIRNDEITVVFAMNKTNHTSLMLCKHEQRGFTLIELMITVAIVGILAAIVTPSYFNYVVKSNRAAAEGYITSVASKQQQFFLDARQYFCTTASANCSQVMAITPPTEVSNNYSISVTADNSTTPPSYEVIATPTGNQARRDTNCGSIKIDQSASKWMKPSGTWLPGTRACW